MKSAKSKLKIGVEVFGQINDYPPTTWKFVGVKNNAPQMEHVKSVAQSKSFPDQWISWEKLARLAAE